jgi:hypothetical protein
MEVVKVSDLAVTFELVVEGLRSVYMRGRKGQKRRALLFVVVVELVKVGLVQIGLVWMVVGIIMVTAKGEHQR